MPSGSGWHDLGTRCPAASTCRPFGLPRDPGRCAEVLVQRPEVLCPLTPQHESLTSLRSPDKPAGPHLTCAAQYLERSAPPRPSRSIPAPVRNRARTSGSGMSTRGRCLCRYARRGGMSPGSCPTRKNQVSPVQVIGKARRALSATFQSCLTMSIVPSENVTCGDTDIFLQGSQVRTILGASRNKHGRPLNKMPSDPSALRNNRPPSRPTTVPTGGAPRHDPLHRPGPCRLEVELQPGVASPVVPAEAWLANPSRPPAQP